MDSILLLLIGVLGIGGGVMNFLGYITASPKADARSPKSFGGIWPLCGDGNRLDRRCILRVGILRWIAYSEQTELIILTVGVIAGVALILYGQLRYNRRF